MNNAAVRDQILKSAKDLAGRLLVVLQSKPREMVNAAARHFRAIQSDLSAGHSSAEEIAARRALIAALPSRLKDGIALVEAATPWCDPGCQRRQTSARPARSLLRACDRAARTGARRYEHVHERGILLPDDAVRDRVAGESGHMKVWDAAERVEHEMAAAEMRLKEDMLVAREAFGETLAALESDVAQLAARVDASQVPSRARLGRCCRRRAHRACRCGWC